MREWCFNLWYWLDMQQRVTAIAAKAYPLDGSDEQKGVALLSASKMDYASVPPVPIKPVHYSEIERLGVESFFAVEFARIQRELPKGTRLPDEKLFWATPLFDFGEGYVPAEIGDGYIRSRD